MLIILFLSTHSSNFDLKSIYKLNFETHTTLKYNIHCLKVHVTNNS